MHTMYEEALREVGALSPKLPKVFEAAEQVITRNIDSKMRALMTANELITFASHLRKNISWKGSSIPVNSIGILIAFSGEGKGVSLGAVQRILEPALVLIDRSREEDSKIRAVIAAEEAGKPETKWREFHSKPRPLIVAVSTLPGWVKVLNTLEEGNFGAGTLYVDEISSELVTSKDLPEIITALSIVYDAGKLPVKALKDDTNQGEPVNNLPVNALLFGSPYGILHNEIAKRKFIDEASSKLARRAIFCFSKEPPKLIEYKSIQESRDADRAETERVTATIESLQPWFTNLVQVVTHDDLDVEPGVEDLYSDYINYNKRLASLKTRLHPLSKLHRQHRQWAALKVAGAIAILEGESTITVKHYVEAINFVEMFTDDLEQFEIELNKESYETASDYMQAAAINGYFRMSIHQLRKMGFIKGNGSPKNKLAEFVELIKSYDDVNKYESDNGYIHFYEADELHQEHEELA